jgi:CBS domain-containing protein
VNGPHYVREAPLVEVTDLALDASLRTAARAMVVRRTPAVLVGGQAILTEPDVVRAVAEGHDLDEAAVCVATPDPLTVTGHATLLEAIDGMLRRRVRTLVVVDDHGHPVGILTLFAAVGALLETNDVPPWLAGLRVALRVEISGA